MQCCHKNLHLTDASFALLKAVAKSASDYGMHLSGYTYISMTEIFVRFFYLPNL